MTESDSDYFGRRREERKAAGNAVLADEQKRLRQWDEQLDALIARFHPQVEHMLGAFAEDAPEIDSYHIYGPEKTGRQINWRLEHSKGEGATRTVLVVLRYLQGPETPEQFTPDCFSVEGLTGITTVRPPTVEALREALGSASFRS